MKINNILWGLLLILLGLVFGLNALGIADIDVFFDGWWTLFIIIPSGLGLLREREKTGNLIGLAIGVALLLACRGLLDFGMILKLIFPVLLVAFGVTLVIKALRADRDARRYIEDHRNETGDCEYCATFSGQKLSFVGEHFRGAKLTAVFGSVDLDLTGAVLDHDVIIDVTAIFGGVDIIVPANYRVRICSNSIFGGVSEEHTHATGEGVITVFVNGNCMFGGVSVK